MQTFLPYADFTQSAKALDYKRLGKQRVEAWQIYQIVSGKRTKGGWINHPAVRMWMGFPHLLAWYYNAMVDEWVERGYKNTMEHIMVPPQITEPLWMNSKDFHDSHKSNLLRKDPEHYSQFGWAVPNDLPYIWLVD